MERDPTIAANHLWPCIKEYVRVEWSANMLARLKETAAKELGFRATAIESASNLARIMLTAGGVLGHAVDIFMVDAAKMRTIALHAAKLRHDLVQKCGGLSLSVFSQCLSFPPNVEPTLPYPALPYPALPCPTPPHRAAPCPMQMSPQRTRPINAFFFFAPSMLFFFALLTRPINTPHHDTPY